jgi:hypothetical protein
VVSVGVSARVVDQNGLPGLTKVPMSRQASVLARLITASVKLWLLTTTVLVQR